MYYVQVPKQIYKKTTIFLFLNMSLNMDKTDKVF